MKLAQFKQIRRGFTLIELLVVIGILAILLAITLIAINPSRQFQQANDTKRASDVNAILNAVGQFAADNHGDLPTAITETDQEITNAAANLCADLVPTYIQALPADPNTNNGAPITLTGTPLACPATYSTGYHIIRDANGRVTVTAPAAQINTPISVTR